MPEDNDLLRPTPAPVAKPPAKGDGVKGNPAYWAAKTGTVAYKSAMRMAGYLPDAEITEKQFREAVEKHGHRVIRSDGGDGGDARQAEVK